MKTTAESPPSTGMPCLMQHINVCNIFLITQKVGGAYEGTLVHTTRPDMYKIGEYSNEWCNLVPYEGSVTLEG